MVDCSQFLDGYSDFRDGQLESEVREAYAAHMADCPGCARYHRVVDRGVQLFRELPEIRPSEDFLPRLQHRIFHLDEEQRRSGSYSSGVSAGLALAIAALLAIAAWVPSVRPRAATLTLPAVAARAPQATQEVPVLFRSGPLLAPSPRAVDHHWNGAGQPTNALFFRYSPLGSAAPAYPVVHTVHHP
jgi:anti-sigma factor RsiW